MTRFDINFMGHFFVPYKRDTYIRDFKCEMCNIRIEYILGHYYKCDDKTSTAEIKISCNEYIIKNIIE